MTLIWENSNRWTHIKHCNCNCNTCIRRKRVLESSMVGAARRALRWSAQAVPWARRVPRRGTPRPAPTPPSCWTLGVFFFGVLLYLVCCNRGNATIEERTDTGAGIDSGTQICSAWFWWNLIHWKALVLSIQSEPILSKSVRYTARYGHFEFLNFQLLKIPPVLTK